MPVGIMCAERTFKTEKNGQEYDEKNNEVKQSAREDKRNRMDGRAEAAEKTAENGRNKEFYNQDTSRGTEETRRRRERQARVTEAQEQLQRWVEHLSEILNRDVPMNPVEEDGEEELEEIEEIDLGRWRIQEVKNALKMTKRGKAAGVDEVGPDLDLLRADMEDIASRLARYY